MDFHSHFLATLMGMTGLLCFQLPTNTSSLPDIGPRPHSIFSAAVSSPPSRKMDVALDILGVSTGMSCSEGKAKLEELGKLLNSNPGRGRSSFHGISYTLVSYTAGMTINNDTIYDSIGIQCILFSESGEGQRIDDGEVVEVVRHVNFEKGSEPALNEIRTKFQEKYGAPTIQFGEFQFGFLYDANSKIVKKDDACGRFDGSNRSTPAAVRMFEQTDTSRCTYAFMMLATEGRIHDTVTELNIVARDFARFESIVTSVGDAQHKLQLQRKSKFKL